MRPGRELLADLAEAIMLARTFLTERGASLDNIISWTGFGRNAAILAAKEAVNENDELPETIRDHVPGGLHGVQGMHQRRDQRSSK